MTPLETPWVVENPEGYYDAIQVTGTTVAPILAGFVFAILALVLVPPGGSNPDPLRWRDPVLALLVTSALLLIISTQTAIRARSTLVKPDELRAWYPDMFESSGLPKTWLKERQKGLDKRTHSASTLCRHTYNAGTLLLFTAIAVLLVPSGSVDDARRVVLVIAAIAIAVEAAWLTGSSLRQSGALARLPTFLTPVIYAASAVAILSFGSAYADRDAAAAGIAIAAAAAGAAALRLVCKGKDARSRVIAVVLLIAVIGGLIASGLLFANSGVAADVTDGAAGGLALFLFMAAVFPSAELKAPTPVHTVE
jgi:hypothetical protein